MSVDGDIVAKSMIQCMAMCSLTLIGIIGCVASITEDDMWTLVRRRQFKMPGRYDTYGYLNKPVTKQYWVAQHCVRD